MILLNQIWKSYGRGRKAKDVLCGISAELDFSQGGLGILGQKKSGKTTLLNIIAGISQPDSGRVSRQVRLSWPLGWRGFRGDMPADGQINFLARIHQADRGSVFRFVAELSGLEKKLYEPVQSLTPREKDRLFLATALAIDFDVYLIDEAMPAIEPGFAADYQSIWEDRLKCSRVLRFTSNTATLSQDCSLTAILDGGRLSDFSSTDQIIPQFIQSARVKRRRKPVNNENGKHIA